MMEILWVTIKGLGFSCVTDVFYQSIYGVSQKTKMFNLKTLKFFQSSKWLKRQ